MNWDLRINDFGLRGSLELYGFPSRKNFVPGIYAKYSFLYSEVFENNSVPSFEFGLPFNINSPDKKKSIVSIAPYMLFENLNRPEDPESTDEPKSNDFVVGLRVGLPVNVLSRQAD